MQLLLTQPQIIQLTQGEAMDNNNDEDSEVAFIQMPPVAEVQRL